MRKFTVITKGMVTKMNIKERKYLVKGKKERLCKSSAFPNDSVLRMEFYIPRNIGTSDVCARFLDDNGTLEENICASWVGICGSNDIYEITMDLREKKTGLYWHDVFIFNGRKKIPMFSSDDYRRQIMIYDKGYRPPKEAEGIIYHVFVDRFFSSGKSPVKPGVIMNTDWENGIPQYPEKQGDPLENNMFFGGDLLGITEKLDYIKSLGTSYIYLSPIFDARSNHKYDTGNYMSVDEMFGGDDALKVLIEEAKKRNIGIIIDGVFNHTGDDSIYFNKYGRYDGVGAYQSSKSKYHKWYYFRNFEKNPDDYDCWWNIGILPRVNCDERSYRNYILGKDGVIDKWFSIGVSGIRLDVADELSDSFIEELRKKVRRKNKDAIIIGEVWEDASNKCSYGNRRKYFYGKELDSVMNYPIRNAVISYIKSGDSDSFRYICESIYEHYPQDISNNLMNVLGTHDTERLITELAGDTPIGKSNHELAKSKLNEDARKHGAEMQILCYMLISALPGIPCVFYGDEIGMEGYHDPFCRRPFNWKNTTAQPCDAYAGIILSAYRKTAMMRIASEALRKGDFRIAYCDKNTVIIIRSSKNESIAVMINRGDSPVNIYSDCIFTEFFTDEKVKTIKLNAKCGKYYKISSAEIPIDEIGFDVEA